MKNIVVKAAFSIWLLILMGEQAYSEKTINHSEGQSKKITFGIVPQQSASKLAKKWIPIIKYLSEKTGYSIKFKTAKNIPSFEDALANGAYDIAYMNPYHYVVFHQVVNYQAFAKAKDKQIKGIIVVRKGSKYQTLTDLSNQPIAFPSPAAFAASILTQAEFHQKGVMIQPEYVQSHDSVYRSVAQGLYSAGGGVIRTLNNLDSSIKDQLTVLWTTHGYTPHAFASNPKLSSEVILEIQKAMLTMSESERGRSLLKSINLTGITAANDNDWDDVRALNIQILNKYLPQ